MRKVITLIAVALLALTGFAQSRNCLRVMHADELSRNAIWIGRVKVRRADKANYRGSFTQVAALQPLDVIEGDFTLKELNVLSQSIVRCAEDLYVKDQEMLVFLEPQDSLFHTLNFQYGQFLIVNDVVKGWRDAQNNPADKSYADVRKEIIAYINSAQTPKSQEPPPPTPSAQQPAHKPPESSSQP
ncbi:MAG TPA: hypothetical protein VJZ91_05855 [Blastocatellia bacterium]|nr:hypothetical protein [Blastocatellia bacterium]